MDVLRRLLASDIPFARDDAHRMLPAMVACLIGFAALLLAVAVSLSDHVSLRARDVTGVLQVEVPPAASAMLDKVTATLRDTPGVTGVAVLREREMEALLKPWLGEDFSLQDLPMPTLIDVKTGVRDKRSAVNVEALRDKLQAMHSLIEVQDRGPWVGQVARATSLLQGLVLLVAALLLACVTGMIVLVARTNLKLHFKAVSLLHLFGATDDYILRQFQWNNAAIAARGAGIGVVFALLVFGGWVVLSHRWDSPVLPPASFSASHLLAFVLLPLLTGLIAFVATRMTVQSMLRHMH
jgi:cell division transport system permease protein